MLVQNKLSKKYCLASKMNRFIMIQYENGDRTFCVKSKFEEDFTRVYKSEKTLVYIVNGAYFTNKFDADWQAYFLNKNGKSIKRSFIYDTPENIMKRINNNDNSI